MTKKGSQTLWYPRYPGDYQRKTSHLSLTEHGVYAVLLDHYYATGKALPADAMQLQRICRALVPHEVEAVHMVVESFFIEKEDGYHNERADEELGKRQEISEKRRIAATSTHDHPVPATGKRRSKSRTNAPANAGTSTSTIYSESSEEDSPFFAAQGEANGGRATVEEMRAIHAAEKGVTRSEAIFSVWWTEFPRQRRGSKPSAWKSWKRIVAAGVDPQSILDGLAPYLASKDVAEGFACTGDDWLNKERWNDQPIPAGQPHARSQPQRARPMDGWLAAIDLASINTSAQMLDWIFQIRQKPWADEVAIKALLDAFDGIFHPQARLCSLGMDTRIDAPQFLRSRFSPSEVGDHVP